MFGCAGEAVSHEIEIDPVEIEDALWVTREEMADVFAGQHPKMKPARQRCDCALSFGKLARGYVGLMYRSH